MIGAEYSDWANYPNPRSVTLFAVISVVLALPLPASQESIEWRTGRDLDQGVKIGITGTWAETPLRSLLSQISTRQRIALFIDRRVDPTVKVNLSARNLNWEQILHEAGRPHGCFFCRMENVYYFGPKEVCLKLPGVYEKLRAELLQRRDDLQVNWRVATETHWPRLSQPGELLRQLGATYGVEILAGDKIELDIWNEFDAPPIPLMLQVVLLTVGFDKSILISKTGRKLKVVNFPKSEKCSWSIDHLKDARSAIRKIKGDFTRLSMRAVSRETAEIQGSVESVYQAISALVGQQQVLGGVGPATYSLELKSTRGSALATIAKQLGVEFEYEADTRKVLAEYIERDFKDVTAEEIIDGVIKGTKLSYRLDANKLSIE